MEIKKIIFYFDNTESIEIPVERIGSILIDDIAESISRLASNYVAKQKYASTFYIEIFNMKSHDKSLLRFKEANDITSFEIIYTDGTKEEIFVDFDDTEYSYTNKNQEVYISKFYNIYICVSNKVNIGNFVDKDIVNDKKYITSAYSLLGIKENKIVFHHF